MGGHMHLKSEVFYLIGCILWFAKIGVAFPLKRARLLLLSHVLDQIDDTVRVAILVVIPINQGVHGKRGCPLPITV